MKLSFCITCYDGDYFLLDSLFDAIQKQTLAPDELIVYSSGFDSSLFFKTKSLQIAGKNIDIIYLNSQKRTIQSFARNACASFASGDIIVFFDVDDIPHFQKLEITKTLFDIHNPDFIVHSYSTTNISDSHIDISKSLIRKDLIIDQSCTNIYSKSHESMIHHAHIAVKRKCFEKIKFNESFEFYRKEDGKFCQDLLINNFNGLYVDEKLVNYTN
jgi:glycosyltransferase involved in cell wall biosynthesis